jgi:hypothetical protein
MIGLRSLAAIAAMIVSVFAISSSAEAGHGSRHGGGYHAGGGARVAYAGPARVSTVRVVRTNVRSYASAYVARPYVSQAYAVRPVRYVQAVRYQPVVYSQATYASYAGGGCHRPRCSCD